MSFDLTRPGVLLVGLVSCALLAPGCSESASEHTHADGSDHDHAPTDATGDDAESSSSFTYEGILGVVIEIPEAGKPATAFRIHHEHIPGFRDPKTGEVFVGASGVSGMRAMIMEMPPAQGVDVSGFAPGDKIRFTMRVTTEPRLAWAVTEIEKLAPATEVSFEDKPAP
ncbi:MAG: hypothetical protein DHS20C14_01170 [Phycisphaeraceae bacterium]|nr:MAG: hypothetical protein DHS20C14_01170 [Phycisphaeraceae bacterium]